MNVDWDWHRVLWMLIGENIKATILQKSDRGMLRFILKLHLTCPYKRIDKEE